MPKNRMSIGLSIPQIFKFENHKKMASKRGMISDVDEILEYIMDDDSADDERIESELSSEDDFEVEHVNAP